MASECRNRTGALELKRSVADSTITRGFAVVASEARSLAGRSAEASREFKSLIAASIERVEHGTALVEQAPRPRCKSEEMLSFMLRC